MNPKSYVFGVQVEDRSRRASCGEITSNAELAARIAACIQASLPVCPSCSRHAVVHARMTAPVYQAARKCLTRREAIECAARLHRSQGGR